MITNMPNLANLVTMKIGEATHRRLKVYAAEHGFTLDEAIADLLERQKDLWPREEVK